MFVLLDRIEHEGRHRFAGHSEAHFRRSAFLASVVQVFCLSETWRASDRPVKTATLDDFFHGKGIAHVVSGG